MLWIGIKEDSNGDPAAIVYRHSGAFYEILMDTSFVSTYGYFEPFSISEFKTFDFVAILNMVPRAGIGILKAKTMNGVY